MTGFKTYSMLLVQVDLEGSTTYGINSPSLVNVAEEKLQLAELIQSALSGHGFSLVSWKGDGGVYAARADGHATWDFAVYAADSVAAVFSDWRNREASRSSLRFRISIHFAPGMAVHKKRGYWHSDDLNAFIKHEREIGVSGTIAITDSAHRRLSQVLDRFVWSRECRIGDSLVKRIYYYPLDSEVQFNRETPLGFFAWLKQNDLPAVDWNHAEIGPQGKAKAFIGDSCVLFAAPHPDSSLTIDFIKSKERTEPPPLTNQERAEWDILKEEVLKRSQGFNEKKVSVRSATTPLTDIPASEVMYKDVSWRDSRSFHALLENNPSTYSRMARSALNIVSEGTTIPGIACCHMIVRTADVVDGTRGILMCQRQNKGAPANSYAQGRWSLSCEEQMRSGESVVRCVQRGLAEELLGSIDNVTPEILNRSGFAGGRFF